MSGSEQFCHKATRSARYGREFELELINDDVLEEVSVVFRWSFAFDSLCDVRNSSSSESARRKSQPIAADNMKRASQRTCATDP